MNHKYWYPNQKSNLCRVWL